MGLICGEWRSPLENDRDAASFACLSACGTNSQIAPTLCANKTSQFFPPPLSPLPRQEPSPVVTPLGTHCEITRAAFWTINMTINVLDIRMCSRRKSVETLTCTLLFLSGKCMRLPRDTTHSRVYQNQCGKRLPKKQIREFRPLCSVPWTRARNRRERPSVYVC